MNCLVNRDLEEFFGGGKIALVLWSDAITAWGKYSMSVLFVVLYGYADTSTVEDSLVLDSLVFYQPQGLVVLCGKNVLCRSINSSEGVMHIGTYLEWTVNITRICH